MEENSWFKSEWIIRLIYAISKNKIKNGDHWKWLCYKMCMTMYGEPLEDP
jgi:hypothetical protein